VLHLLVLHPLAQHMDDPIHHFHLLPVLHLLVPIHHFHPLLVLARVLFLLLALALFPLQAVRLLPAFHPILP
jgi:hypothetical protein